MRLDRATLRHSFALFVIGMVSMRYARSQTSATVKIEHAEVTAGDPLAIILTFDSPPSCETSGRVLFTNSKGQGLDLRGDLKTNSNIVKMSLVNSMTIPLDYRGEFSISETDSWIFPCPGYSEIKHFTVGPVTVHVSGVPDKNTYPTKAAVVLSLNQKQFLNTKATELDALTGEIDTRVEHNGIDSSDLRKFLAGIVEHAEGFLSVAEAQYRKQFLETGDPSPAFFADFGRQYSALHVELRAPIPGTSAATYAVGHVLNVQQPLKRHPQSDTSGLGRNLSGTSPAIARATKATLHDNASAYRDVEKMGNPKKPRFQARFESLPTGATMSYRQKILPDFQEWPSKTDIAKADFDLATFIFKFHKDGCADEPAVEVNPYDDTNPTVSVEFRRCEKR